MSRPRLFKDTVLYAVTNIATKMVGALLLPILTRLLSPGEYGAIDVILLGSLLALEIALLGTDYILALYYHDKAIQKHQLVGTFIIVRLGLSILTGWAIWMLAPLLTRYSFGAYTNHATLAIRIAAITLPATGLLNGWFTLLRQRGQSMALFSCTIVRVLISATATIILLAYAFPPIPGYFLAILLVDGLLAVTLTFMFRRTIGRPTLSLAIVLMRKGSAFFPRSAYFVVMALVTRQLLLTFSSLDAVGQYAAAVKVSYIVWIAVSASSQAWLAYSMSIAEQPDAREQYSRYLSRYIIVIGTAVVIISTFAADILSILTTQAYIVAAPTVGFQALSLMAVGSLVIITTGLNIRKETAIIGTTTIVTALINVALAAWLIPHLGIMGVALTSAIDQSGAALILYIIVQQRYPIPTEKSWVIWLGLIISWVIFASFLPTFVSWDLLILKVIMVGLYGMLMIAFGALRDLPIKSLLRIYSLRRTSQK